MTKAITIPKVEKATRTVAVRFAPSEYALLEAEAQRLGSGIKVSTLIRVSMIECLRAGIKFC